MTNYYQHNGTNYVHVSDYAALEARLAEVAANAPWLTQAHILCSDHGIPPGNISDRLSLLRIRLAELPEKLAEAEAERDALLETQRKFGSMMHEQMDKLDEAETLLSEYRHFVKKCSCGADQPGAIIGSEIKRDNRLHADQLAAAGYTKRDTRLQCDECGRMFTRQMLPIHKCTADKSGASK